MGDDKIPTIENELLKKAWAIAIEMMRTSEEHLESKGFCKNVRMEPLMVQGIGGQACVGYVVSAFNGTTTKKVRVYFPDLPKGDIDAE